MALPCAASLSRVAAAPEAAQQQLPKPRGGLRARLLPLFALLVVCCALGLVSVASLIQQRDLQLLRVSSGSRVRVPSAPSSVPRDADGDGPGPGPGPNPEHARADAVPRDGDAPGLDESSAWREDLDAYECVGWRAQRDCSPDGGADPENDRACNATVRAGESGYCLLRHARSGQQQRALRMHCDSLRDGVAFTCGEFRELLALGPQLASYRHDPRLSLEDTRAWLVEDAAAGVPASPSEPSRAAVPSNFSRAVLMVVYEPMLESVYASVRSLRAMGCALPVELWYVPGETDPRHPLLRALVREHGCFLRAVRDARASRFYTKPYAVLFSAFDAVLLLDADNFAARDPTALFDAPAFRDTGALFWPDFWRPRKTIFNIHARSFLWELLGVDFADMFEQESGQLLVDRARHVASGALDALAFLSLVAAPTLERTRVVWGDKDLFRLAWMKTGAAFHMIATPPGAAGLKLPERNIFCGVTMVQHDPSGDIAFLHRNQEKLSRANRARVWDHVQQFRAADAPLELYDVRGANGGRYFPQFRRCYGKDIYYEQAFTVTPVEDSPVAELEAMLLAFVDEAVAMEDADAANTDAGDAAAVDGDADGDGDGDGDDGDRTRR